MPTLNRFLLTFLRTEAGSGMILAVCALVAIIWANTPLAPAYFALVHYDLPGPWGHAWRLAEWVKEGLMAVFFYMVGLEIKNEFLHGELSDPKTLALPVAAAAGGMIVPALLYVLCNLHGDLRGWPVPVATDIAFALAVLAMVGKGLPQSLRVFLLTLAIVDDLGAVVIIGTVYHTAFNLGAVAAVLGLLLATVIARFARYRLRGPIYLALFVATWWIGLKAGLSPSLVAVVSAFCVRGDYLKALIHRLHPFTAYAVLPLFALTSAGFSLAGFGLASLADSRFVGVVAGLFIGKQMGVFAAARLMIALGWARMPAMATSVQLYGVCLLCGIGFTMSLFLAGLAVPQGEEIAQNALKSAIAVASILSGCAGAITIRLARKRPENHQ